MIFGAILAGGTGTRMGNIEKPKQFLLLGDKPIIIHTIEKFYINNSFEKIIVLCPKNWIKYTEDLINKYITNSDSLNNSDKIEVIEGGNLRNETIMNAISYIETNYKLTDEDIIVTHDSVRPFITHRILTENIKYAAEYDACDTVIPATDTIVETKDNKFISNIPNRKNMFQGQTPQSFKINKIKTLYNKISDKEKHMLTDACKIFSINNKKVFLIEGEVTNIKITYPHDLKVANSILKGY
ncbi:putative ribitol-5-phosphate cytidylyltransferase [Methanobrevibacter cuticularis]|uniref:Putative ribitol-5-phosphate cytidylyltransferase n=1 Tax=Methanobrevibacter cuticularis TaxID=47311 RepID=A0A166DZV7_9EURY|nr:2-C-methyl-D-erythritol 4-phosphate cytidylyltransferase [Methanobrevibacter cuticularis]KZX16128.1 putative ribitol-5-phosphate cytidylyltransferase [Methanobrevibacter cuticularis]